MWLFTYFHLDCDVNFKRHFFDIKVVFYHLTIRLLTSMQFQAGCKCGCLHIFVLIVMFIFKTFLWYKSCFYRLTIRILTSMQFQACKWGCLHIFVLITMWIIIHFFNIKLVFTSENQTFNINSMSGRM